VVVVGCGFFVFCFLFGFFGSGFIMVTGDFLGGVSCELLYHPEFCHPELFEGLSKGGSCRLADHRTCELWNM
jgi:hypothetical protein